jgi:hypothetical protein
MTRIIKNQDKHKNIIEFRPDDKNIDISLMEKLKKV